MKFASLFVFVFLLSLSFVSAQYYGGYGPSYGGGFFGGTQQVVDSLVQNLEPLLRALLGGNDWTGYLLFEKTLLFILIAIIVGIILTNVPVFSGLKNKGILRLVAVIVALLGVRNLNYIWIGTILVQYQVLFIAVAGILPFLIYWTFVNSFKGEENSWLRKAMWCFYTIVYLGLWMTTELEAYASIYLWGAIASLVYAFFIDEHLMRWMQLREIKLGLSERKWEQINALNKKIDELNNPSNSTPANLRKTIIARLESQRDSIIKSL